jgi:hypothetical protein
MNDRPILTNYTDHLKAEYVGMTGDRLRAVPMVAA